MREDGRKDRHTESLIAILHAPRGGDEVRKPTSCSQKFVVRSTPQSCANRGGFRHVQHVRPNRDPHKSGTTRGPFVALNSTYSRPCVLCAYNYVMQVLNKMSMMTTLSLCVSCEFSRAVFVYGRGPTAPIFFLNRALLRLNPALYAK